jgi:hypothetical protein
MIKIEWPAAGVIPIRSSVGLVQWSWSMIKYASVESSVEFTNSSSLGEARNCCPD